MLGGYLSWHYRVREGRHSTWSWAARASCMRLMPALSHAPCLRRLSNPSQQQRSLLRDSTGCIVRAVPSQLYGTMLLGTDNNSRHCFLP